MTRAWTFRFDGRSLKLPLRSLRLVYRLPRLSDIPAYVELLNDPVVQRGTLRIPSPYRAADGRAFLRHADQKRREGSYLPLAIERRSDGRLIGGIGLHDLTSRETAAEVGYWIGAGFRRQGYATEALERIVRAAFGPLGVHRLQAHVFAWNRASVGVLRRVGFQREGLVRDAHQKDGQWVSEIQFARLSTDPPSRRTRSRESTHRSGTAD